MDVDPADVQEVDEAEVLKAVKKYDFGVVTRPMAVLRSSRVPNCSDI